MSLVRRRGLLDSTVIGGSYVLAGNGRYQGRNLTEVLVGATTAAPTNNASYGFAAQDAKYGDPLPVVRWYRADGAGPPQPGDINSYILDGRTIVYSWKDDPDTVAAGGDDAIMQTHLQSLPATTTVYYCYYHEPENNMTGAQYRAAQDHIIPVIRATPGVVATVIPICIFTAYTFGPTPNIQIDDYWPTCVPEVLGVDVDGTSAIGASAYHNYVTPFQAAAVHAQSKGTTRMGIPEFAEGRISSDSDGSARLAWMQRQVTGFQATNVLEFMMWYDASSGNSSGYLTLEPGQPECTYWSNLVDASVSGL